MQGKTGPATRILVVDDDQAIVDAVSRYLRRLGHECAGLISPMEVLPWLSQNQCDVLIVDLIMPEMDGIDLIKEVRKTHATLPIIVLTGVGYDETRIQEALDAKANGYVSKALAFTELYQAVERAVGGR